MQDPPWYRLVEPFQFFAFSGKGPHASLICDALRVRRRLYREQFGNTPLADADDYDEDAVHVLTYLHGEPVCSCRIVSQCAALGLELARYADVWDLHSEDRTYAEISRLALASEYRRITSQSFLLLGLLKTTLAVAQGQRFTDYLIWVRPPLVPLYRALGFVDIPGRSFPHAALANTVHQVMRLDMTQFDTNRQRPMARVYFDPLPSNITILLNGHS